MKATAILLALFPIVCVAQQESRLSTETKPATDACPTWENKKQPSKAEYFQSLRTSGKTKEQQLAYTNKKEVTESKKPAEKPVTQKAYIPAFSSGSDAILEGRSSDVKKEEVEKPLEVEKPEKKESVQTALNSDRSKTKSKKKKTSNCSGTTKKVSKHNNAKCPAF